MRPVSSVLAGQITRRVAPSVAPSTGCSIIILILFFRMNIVHSSSSSSSDCCAGQRSTPHSRTLEVRPGRITKKLGLRYDCDCERDETKSLLGVLMLGCDILIASDE